MNASALFRFCALIVLPSNEVLAEGTHLQRMLREPAAREAFTAFMQKRRPDFSNL